MNKNDYKIIQWQIPLIIGFSLKNIISRYRVILFIIKLCKIYKLYYLMIFILQ